MNEIYSYDIAKGLARMDDMFDYSQMAREAIKSHFSMTQLLLACMCASQLSTFSFSLPQMFLFHVLLLQSSFESLFLFT